MENTTYKEIQRISHWWIWILIIGLLIIPVYGIYKQMLLGEALGNNPMSDTGLIVFAILMLCLVLALSSMSLKTEINKSEIRLRFHPFLNRSFLWDDIHSAEVIKYGFVGGWGIRLWRKYGVVYNIRGNKGLAIEMKNGDKYLIGTQKEEALTKFLRELPDLRNQS